MNMNERVIKNEEECEEERKYLASGCTVTLGKADSEKVKLIS